MARDPKTVGRIFREGGKRVIRIRTRRVQEGSTQEKQGPEERSDGACLVTLVQMLGLLTPMVRRYSRGMATPSSVRNAS